MTQTPFQNALGADLEAICADALGPGEAISILPEGRAEEAVEARALFEAPGAEERPQGASAAVVSVAPSLHIPVQTVQMALGRPLSTRDRIAVRGQLYRVRNPQDDGFGLLRIGLLAVGGPVAPGYLSPESNAREGA